MSALCVAVLIVPDLPADVAVMETVGPFRSREAAEAWVAERAVDEPPHRYPGCEWVVRLASTPDEWEYDDQRRRERLIAVAPEVVAPRVGGADVRHLRTR